MAAITCFNLNWDSSRKFFIIDAVVDVMLLQLLLFHDAGANLSNISMLYGIFFRVSEVGV